MSEATFHVTKDEIRKPESHLARARGGYVPANSSVSAMKVITIAFLFILEVLTLTKHSPSSTPTPTNPNKSSRPNPTYLCLTSRRPPATGTPLISALSTLALVALKLAFLAMVTALCGDQPLRRAVCALMGRNITSKRSQRAMLGDRARMI